MFDLVISYDEGQLRFVQKLLSVAVKIPASDAVKVLTKMQEALKAIEKRTVSVGGFGFKFSYDTENDLFIITCTDHNKMMVGVSIEYYSNKMKMEMAVSRLIKELSPVQEDMLLFLDYRGGLRFMHYCKDGDKYEDDVVLNVNRKTAVEFIERMIKCVTYAEFARGVDVGDYTVFMECNYGTLSINFLVGERGDKRSIGKFKYSGYHSHDTLRAGLTSTHDLLSTAL